MDTTTTTGYYQQHDSLQGEHFHENEIYQQIPPDPVLDNTLSQLNPSVEKLIEKPETAFDQK